MKPAPRKSCAFTLIELLIVVSLVAALSVLAIGAIQKVSSASESARCVSSLRQLGMAVQLYTQEHSGKFPHYYRDEPGVGRFWYFGFEPQSSSGGPEGERTIIAEKGPLYPYTQSVGQIEICPAFPYGKDYWKPKFRGASFGYGYNVFLAPLKNLAPGTPSVSVPISVLNVAKPSQVILFGDCAQINTFQAPASASNPLLEEFYIIDNSHQTVHFRHNGKANMLFVDGHVEAFELFDGTRDKNSSTEIVGRITRRGSMRYLE